ncbi:MAG: hypothetical protein AB7C97_08790 [Oscillospiraceae bacterium]
MDTLKLNIPDMLGRQMKSGSLSHAYIISGPPGSGKKGLAETLAAAIVCSCDKDKPCKTCSHCRKAFAGIHPDIRCVTREKDKKEITVGQMREVRADAAVVPNEAAKKVYIIYEADNMGISAQNAILKLLEEPPSHAAFILTAENPAGLLPTVRSRCVEFSLLPPSRVNIDEDDGRAAEFMALLANGNRLGLTEFLFSLERMDKNDFAIFCRLIKRLSMDMLRGHYAGGESPITCGTLIRVIRIFEEAERYIDFNVGTGHITGLVLAELL